MILSPANFDFIGDVHGQITRLRHLLNALGYREQHGTFHPPEGVTAVFLGDLSDPKPSHPCPGGVRECLHLVKAMCDAGHAICLLGNHELNALHFHTAGSDGRPLRPHTPQNVRAHQATLDDFPDHADREGEWRSVWLPWFRDLPLYFDAGSVRAVHACWHPRHIATISGRSLEDPAFMTASADRRTDDGEAMEAVLKGIELPVPGGVSFIDHTGSPRRHFRVRWWEHAGEPVSCRDLVFPANPVMPDAVMAKKDLEALCPYPPEAPPIFFGHYLKSAGYGIHPDAPNVACLDYGVAKGGPLVAYRWRGEPKLFRDHYVVAPPSGTPLEPATEAES